MITSLLFVIFFTLQWDPDFWCNDTVIVLLYNHKMKTQKLAYHLKERHRNDLNGKTRQCPLKMHDSKGAAVETMG